VNPSCLLYTCIVFPHLGQSGLVVNWILVTLEVNCLLHIMQRKRCFPVHAFPYLYMASEPQAGHVVSEALVFDSLVGFTVHSVTNDCYDFVNAVWNSC
jgi:hypothetical protein